MLRTEGLRSVTRKGLARIVYGRVILLELDLAEMRDASSTIPLHVQRLEPEHFPAYLRARPDLGEGELRQRLANGDWCYVAWTGDRITSTVWYGVGRRWIPEIASSIELKPRQAFAYDGWTAPELRGRNIAAARGVRSYATLRDAGFRTAVVHVLAGNRASVRALGKVGFRRTAVLGSVRLWCFRLDFTSTDHGRAEWKLRRHRRGGAKLSRALGELGQMAADR